MVVLHPDAPRRAAVLVSLVLSLACTGTAQHPVQEPKPVAQPKPNRLATSTSPYLRQHANNPVDWYPWGKEALDRAKKEGKPIFLSIGYSACHWCHVMEHESFENAATAALMNDNFVCIKVDREERPDLDEIYMTAVQAMTGSGGWPMSVWLTPDLQPFYGGTYFPPEDAHGRPGFPRVLQQLAKVWTERREDCERGAAQLTEHLQKVLRPTSESSVLESGIAESMRAQSSERYDATHGGFAEAPHYAPKFPHPSELLVLLRLAAKGDEAARTMARTTLDRMAAGGMNDQLGFGFHRYSTDREWLVPHFEKMLYDNAQLAVVYAESFAATKDERHGAVVRRTLDYCLRELRDGKGGFWSSQDADSEGVEGKFFVWSLEEWNRLLGDDASLAASRWGVTAAGNWEGHNVLFDAVSVDTLAKTLGKDPVDLAARLENARLALFTARSTRVRPGTDDKVLAAWNGLAIGAFARAAQVFGEERYVVAAREGAAFVLDSMIVEGRLRRSWRDGRAEGPAFLEDHAFVADALLTLFETDADPRWLAAARDLLATAVKRFGDDTDGGFHFTSDDHEALPTRSKNATESSTPSGVAVMAMALLRAGLLLGDEALFARGEKALLANASLLARAPVAAPSLVAAVQFLQGDPREVVVAGEPGDPRTQALLDAARRRFPSLGVVAHVHDGNRAALERLSPTFVGKRPIEGRPCAYVCRRGVCEAPVFEPEALQR